MMPIHLILVTIIHFISLINIPKYKINKHLNNISDMTQTVVIIICCLFIHVYCRLIVCYFHLKQYLEE